MKHDDLWKFLIIKYPDWTSTGAHFSANGIKDFFRRVFEWGREEGRREVMEEMNRSISAEIPDFMKGMFQ